MPQVFNLVHLTDFHLFQARGASWHDFMNKRLLSYLSWRLRRGKKNAPAVLSAIIDFIPTLDWDQVAITGDLTHMGLPLEYRQAHRFLKRIGPPEAVFVIPGNHDALVPPRAATYQDVWRHYLQSDAPYRNGQFSAPDGYPAVRQRNGVVLIGLSSACPTPPFSAAGRLGKAQCRRLASILEATGRQHLFRVLLVHHPIVVGQISPRKALRDAAMLRSILARYGAELVLHGHNHHHSRAQLPGPRAPVPVLGLPSSTAHHAVPATSACLRVFTVRPSGGGWQIEVRDHHVSPHGCVRPVVAFGGLTTWQTIPNITA